MFLGNYGASFIKNNFGGIKNEICAVKIGLNYYIYLDKC